MAEAVTHDLFPLQMLPPGQIASIDQLLGDADSVHRLEEMGLRVGEHVEMVQAGSPCIIRLRGHKLCLRDGNLFQVLVRKKDVA
ncbi:MAG TPA: FeoA family protein [Pirellulaceae bacterium]|nr:FeoA family protein [Pirellulaceae bacterium]